MSEKSPTPDLLPRFNKACHLDKTEHGQIGHDMAKIIHGARDIAKSPNGPKLSPGLRPQAHGDE